MMLSTAKPPSEVKPNQLAKLKKLKLRHSTPEALYANLAILLMSSPINYE